MTNAGIPDDPLPGLRIDAHRSSGRSRLTTPGAFLIRRCRACGSAFVWPGPRQEEIAAFYSGARYKNLSTEDFRDLERTYYPTASMDAARLISRCRRLSGGPRLMDVGAGFGEFSKAARDAGFEVTACEPNANSRRIFKEVNGFDPEPDMFDEVFAAKYEGRFDVALASHILEHIIDPKAFVANLSAILVPDGIVAVAVPHFGSLLSRLQGKKDMFICPPEHLNFFSRRGLIALFERSGFRADRRGDGLEDQSDEDPQGVAEGPFAAIGPGAAFIGR